MPLARDVSELLKASGHRLSKDFGQHFLVEEAILNTMTESAHLQRSDHVLEIGAGIGVLTKQLLEMVDHVTSIEVDSRWIPLLTHYVGQDAIDSGRLTLIRGDALRTPFPQEPYKIVANIPYQITSPLLRHAFLEASTSPTSVTILIQKEVAEKICSRADRGVLTVMVELFGVATFVRNVPPGCFLPPPKVDSAIIHIESHKTPLADEATLAMALRLTGIAFAGRRKMLRRTVGTFQQGLEWLKTASIDGERRPETVSVTEWVSLATAAMHDAA